MTGYLDLRDEGYGFLRTSGYLSGPGDVYVSISQARRFALRKGDSIEGFCRPAGSTEKFPALSSREGTEIFPVSTPWLVRVP